MLCFSSLVAPKQKGQTDVEAMLQQWHNTPQSKCMREWRGPLPTGTTQVVHVRTQSKQADGTSINKYSEYFVQILTIH